MKRRLSPERIPTTRGRKRKREKKEERRGEESSFRKNHLKQIVSSFSSLEERERKRGLHEILESETMATGALASEKIIARNKIFRVAGPFLLSVLAFKCKVLFKSRQVSTTPSVSLIAPLSRPFPPIPFLPSLIPFVFHSFFPSSPPPLFPPFDSISFIRRSSLPRRRSRTQQQQQHQLRRPWDKRLHFLIFKCAQTSYPAIVCPTEALPRRGFRADKPFSTLDACRPPTSLHPLPLCSLSLSLFFQKNASTLSFPLSPGMDYPTPRRWTSLRQFAVENANRQRESNGYEIVRDLSLPLSF